MQNCSKYAKCCFKKQDFKKQDSLVPVAITVHKFHGGTVGEGEFWRRFVLLGKPVCKTANTRTCRA